MSRSRFSLLLALLVMVVAVATFAGVTMLLGDESSAPPGTDASAPPTAPTSSTSTTSTTTGAAGDLVTPSFVVVVTSSTSERDAQATRDDLTESGYDSGVLRSDDYPSLEPGFFVAYVGPFTDAEAADADKARLDDDGYDQAYTRCLGTAQECS